MLQWNFLEEIVGPSARDQIIKKFTNTGAEDNFSKSAFHPPTSLYSIKNATVIEKGWILNDDGSALFSLGNIQLYPGYVKKYYEEGLLYPIHGKKNIFELGGTTLKPIRLNNAYNILHFNLVYGHWLLEIFPRLFIIQDLYGRGFDYPVIIPHGLPPFVLNHIYELFPDIEIILFDSDYEKIFVNDLIVFDYHEIYWGNKYFRNKINTIVCTNNNYQDRIFIARPENHYSTRNFENQREVENFLRTFGFDTIEPSSYSIREQIKIFSNAKFVVGEFNSALHNAFFTQNEKCCVLSINYINSIQNEIAISNNTSIGYLLPNDKIIKWNEKSNFRVDLNKLASMGFD